MCLYLSCRLLFGDQTTRVVLKWTPNLLKRVSRGHPDWPDDGFFSFGCLCIPPVVQLFHSVCISWFSKVFNDICRICQLLQTWTLHIIDNKLYISYKWSHLLLSFFLFFLWHFYLYWTQDYWGTTYYYLFTVL